MQTAKSKGILILIGGAEDKTGECLVLREFVRQAGGEAARIALITIASQMPGTGKAYKQLFKKLGANSVDILDLTNREAISASVKVAQHCTGVFFTGGNQFAIIAGIGGTALDRYLHEAYEKGLVIAGTSAGAAIMANSMILKGLSQVNPRKNAVAISPGLELLLGAIVDTHFSERGRHGRLLTAVAQCPHDIGIGIDEDTAAIVQGSRMKVIGRGAVTIIDVGNATYDNLSILGEEDSLALYNVKLHVLPEKHEFDLQKRKPVPGILSTTLRSKVAAP